jgi:hypothetical protein
MNECILSFTIKSVKIFFGWKPSHTRVGHGSGPSAGRVGLGRVGSWKSWNGTGRVGSKKLDPWPTLEQNLFSTFRYMNMENRSIAKLKIKESNSPFVPVGRPLPFPFLPSDKMTPWWKKKRRNIYEMTSLSFIEGWRFLQWFQIGLNTDKFRKNDDRFVFGSRNSLVENEPFKDPENRYMTVSFCPLRTNKLRKKKRVRIYENRFIYTRRRATVTEAIDTKLRCANVLWVKQFHNVWRRSVKGSGICGLSDFQRCVEVKPSS